VALTIMALVRKITKRAFAVGCMMNTEKKLSRAKMIPHIKESKIPKRMLKMM
jgi:hypothetical protein